MCQLVVLPSCYYGKSPRVSTICTCVSVTIRAFHEYLTAAVCANGKVSEVTSGMKQDDVEEGCVWYLHCSTCTLMQSFTLL